MAPRPGPPVLVVDDDPVLRGVVADTLEAAGYPVEQAADGEEALRVAAGARPGLILLDLGLPRLDGWGFLGAYRAGAGPRAPVVLCTAAGDLHERPLAVRADGVLEKPLDLVALLLVVRHYLGAPAPR